MMEYRDPEQFKREDLPLTTRLRLLAEHPTILVRPEMREVIREAADTIDAKPEVLRLSARGLPEMLQLSTGGLLETEFACGEYVSWASQAGGGTRKKLGKIVGVIGAFTHPKDIYTPEHDAFRDLRLDICSAVPRGHKSYIVEVQSPGRRPRFYWPRVSRLKHATFEDFMGSGVG